MTQQLDIAVTDPEGNEFDVDFKSDFTLAFDTDSGVKIQFGAREDAKGKWKIIQGELDGDTFTLSVNEFGSYTVVTNKGQAKKR